MTAGREVSSTRLDECGDEQIAEFKYAQME